MNNAIINIKTDPQTKLQIKEFAGELGMPVSVIINAQIKQMLDRKIVLGTELEPTPYLEKIMKQIKIDVCEDKNITTVKNSKELLDHLNSL